MKLPHFLTVLLGGATMLVASHSAVHSWKRGPARLNLNETQTLSNFLIDEEAQRALEAELVERRKRKGNNDRPLRVVFLLSSGKRSE